MTCPRSILALSHYYTMSRSAVITCLYAISSAHHHIQIYQSNQGSLARLMSGDLPLPHHWLPMEERILTGFSSSFSFSFSSSFDYTGVATPGPSPVLTTPPSAMVTPPPSAMITAPPSAKLTAAPTVAGAPSLTVTIAPTAVPMISVISIRLKMGGNPQQRLGAVNAILALIGQRLNVKGKIYKAVEPVANTETAGANNGQGTNGGNGNGTNNGTGGAPGNTTEVANYGTASANNSTNGNSGASGRESNLHGSSGKHASSTLNNGQGSTDPKHSADFDPPKKDSRDFASSSSSRQDA